MANGWEMMRFGGVLKPASRPVPIEPDKTYRILGMRWYAQGLFLKEEKPGQEIRAKEVYRVELGDFVYNRLFAWKGSFGIVERDTAGGFVSGEFPCFRVDTERADAKFLHLFLSQERVWGDIGRNSSGQTNISRLRLKEQDFLRMEIPLPPLSEQQRIVARVDALARRVEEARGLRRAAVEEAGAIMRSGRVEVFNAVDLTKYGKPLGEIATFLDGKRIPINAKQRAGKQPGDIPYYGASGIVEYINEWIFDEPLLLISEDGANIELRSKPIAFVIRGKTWVNNHAHVLRLANELTAIFLSHYVESLDVRPYWQGATRPKINKSDLERMPVPDLPLAEQRRIVAYLDGLQAKVDELRRLQAATQKELDALMPSILAKAFAGEL